MITVSFTNKGQIDIITNPVVIQWNVHSQLFLLKMFHLNISNHETIRQIQIVGNPMRKWPGLFKMSVSWKEKKKVKLFCSRKEARQTWPIAVSAKNKTKTTALKNILEATGYVWIQTDKYSGYKNGIMITQILFFGHPCCSSQGWETVSATYIEIVKKHTNL